MRKLTADEEHALAVLTKHGGSYCPMSTMGADTIYLLAVMHSLVIKKRAWVEPTDVGPRFHAL